MVSRTLRALAIALAAVAILAAASTHAYGNYIMMKNTGDSGGYPWKQCYYEGTYQSDIRISIMHNGGYCPTFIKYYPATGEWSK